MRILAIETSCDETGIALVEGTKAGWSLQFQVKKEALLSQAALHAPYGGVYPNLAKREHAKNLPILFKDFENEEYEAIAVTVGPGLEPALWEGITFARELSAKKKVPLIPINHMEGHFISSLAQPIHYSSVLQNYVIKNVRTPMLALLVSGGHTEFVLSKEWLKYEIIGETLDDAVGECFDKVARMLGLPYPGGPEISKLSAKATGPSEIKLPRPMLNSGTCDVSFSGLKTAALYALRDKKLNEEQKASFAKEFEEAVTDVFIAKTRKALTDTGAKTFILGGGVAANRYLREQLQKLLQKEFSEVQVCLPDSSITGDNAVMIAHAALARLLSGPQYIPSYELRAVGNLSIEK